MFGNDNDILMKLLLGDKAENYPDFLTKGMPITPPGPMGGFAGGTYTPQGQQVTPVRQEMEPPATLPEKIGYMGGAAEAPQLPDYGDDKADVSVDGWKPKKPTTLGTIADILLGAFGGPMIFHQKARRENIQGAMEGFTQDPLNTIRRLARIPGQEGNAWKMYGQYRDDTRADSVADINRMIKQERMNGTISAMLGAVEASPDPNAAYRKMLPNIRRYAESYGGDVSDLGDEYDSDVIRARRFRGTTADQQFDNERTDRYQSERLEDYDLDRSQRQSQFETREGNADRRLEYRENRADQRKTIGGGSKAKPNGPRVRHPYAFRDIKDANGNVVGIVNKEGTVAQMAAPDGGVQYFEVLPNGKLGKRITE